ncbi:uncharacterized protein CIMG_06252 [Coccidioides immitis RS]|uniref:Indole-diterpene biosynthesis protein PaxU n=4 Tax=Coccidioides immitis TaxID=5501 RepID=A0A0E1S1T0_COCIM|nr:uncharacterized protein CIMG_06252 [Coccidioides immitis RS]EAS30773.1 hypothetical protein CIMG_06252 [Coccidioides immitis RS]KMP03354.1 hypothetical protein CIRG_03046 [Coccidioides immitis RMSCC 2394]KMU73893.1 hypothetical protein CISG_03871 [Coccidioides immitis RMSCC 3703]KMU84935.1 hypothetical protein CIHG_02718 [Coccidioides immitis H538.4]
MASSIEQIVPPIFSTMAQLGPGVYIRDFPQTLEKRDKSLTIVLFFWMNATHRPAGKYIAQYTQIAPTARIISIFTSASDFFIRNSDVAQKRRIAPVLNAILSTGGSGIGTDSTGEHLYIHTFSNGGSTTLRHLAASYRATTGKPLPVKALLIDSAPGKNSISKAVQALSYSFPKFFLWRALLSATVWTWLLVLTTLGKLLRKKHPSFRLREGLNDSKLIDGGAERCYVYSKEDELIHWRDVEEHAEDARAKGWNVSREMFEKSPHVSHMRTDPQRYWRIVGRLLKIAMG